jgi:CDP-paratose 2-epimerase
VPVAIVTGSSGLVGSEAARFLHEQGLDVVGIDNDLRAYFFGPEASVGWNARRLQQELKRFTHHDLDVRDEAAIAGVFRRHGVDVALVVHCAAQPSHDWAAREPVTDFTVNANGTLVLLEAVRRFCPEAVFIFVSTNKVYGDAPNGLPLVEHPRRWELEPSHPFAEHGIDESMSVDRSLHSLFGASKLAADVLVQEYGRYFGIRTACFRGGCLTGPAHAGAELHGFLAYLVRCAVTGRPYTVHGYKGKQVRDNIDARDLVRAFWHFYRGPRAGAVFNIGGARANSCSVLEAIDLVERLAGRSVDHRIGEPARRGDHVWWITDVRKFRREFPAWAPVHGLERTVAEMVDAARERLR